METMICVRDYRLIELMTRVLNHFLKKSKRFPD